MSQKNHRLNQKLQLNKFKLAALLDITKAINNKVPTDQLVETYRNIVQDELGISKLILYIKSVNSWVVSLEYGQGATESSINPEITFDGINDITVLNESSHGHVGGYDVLIPVFHEDKPLAYLLIGDLNEEEVVISPTIKHMNFIQTMTNIIGVAIENKRLAEENLRQVRVKRDLELAAEMQSFLVPKNLPSNEMIDMSGVYLPHQETGGDYYDYIYLGENRFVFCIADVSGKGIAAAFLMANFQAYLKSLVSSTDSLDELIKLLNKRVYESSRGEKFITFFIGVCDMNAANMMYVNAGHNPPIHSRSGQSTELKEGCVGLGMLEDIDDIKVGSIGISKGDTIVSFTDGLVEMENEENEEFGISRIENVLASYSGQSMEKFNRELLDTFNDFCADKPPFDDIALLSFRRN